jgi:hypothetical protein
MQILRRLLAPQNDNSQFQMHPILIFAKGMKGINHGDKILVGNIVHGTVTAGAAPLRRRLSGTAR